MVVILTVRPYEEKCVAVLVVILMCGSFECNVYLCNGDPATGGQFDQNSVVVFVVIITHWGRVTHICVSKLTIIGSDNGLSPGRRQAIIWTNAGILLIGPLGTNFSETLIEMQIFSFKKMHLKMSSGGHLSRPQDLWPF